MPEKQRSGDRAINQLYLNLDQLIFRMDQVDRLLKQHYGIKEVDYRALKKFLDEVDQGNKIIIK